MDATPEATRGKAMKREFKKKGRETKRLPPEKLYTILCGIYPKEIADEKYTELMGLKPPESEGE